MKNTLSLILLIFVLISCSSKHPLVSVKKNNRNRINNSVKDTVKSFGYVPIDPMPLKIQDYGGYFNITNEHYLNSLSDETILVATGKYNSNGTITFGPISSTIEGEKYIVILDWIKYTTIPQIVIENENGDTELFNEDKHKDSKKIKNSIPIYAGVGLRVQANFTANSANVDVNSIFGISGNYNTSDFKGTLVIQSMGISGKSVNLPLPSSINPTAIQNALMAISAIRSQVYTSEDKDLKITPRIIGFYNTIGNKTNRHQMVSFLSSLEIPFKAKISSKQEIEYIKNKVKLEKELDKIRSEYLKNGF